MNPTAALLLLVLGTLPLFSACDSKPAANPERPATSAEEVILSTKAQDCVTEYIKRSFAPDISDLEQARSAVGACEQYILRFEQIRGVSEPGTNLGLESLLAERAASGPAAEAQKRAHELRLESWRLAQKVAQDFQAALKPAGSPNTVSAASAPGR